MDNLDKLLYWRGIANEYFNYRGEKVVVSLDNRMRLLSAMGVNIDSPEVIEQQAYELDIEPWKNWLASFLMAETPDNACFEINLSPEFLDCEFEYFIQLEGGEALEGSFKPSNFNEIGDYIYEGVRYSRRAIEVGAVPLGYHRLTVVEAVSQGQESSQLVVVPEHVYTPEWVEAGAKPWGVIVQLYTLRSERNWGIGDFSDLKLLVKESAAAGADMVGLNPLHALRYPVEHHCSPYSPSDRRFLNPLYIDPEAEAEFPGYSSELKQTLAKLRSQTKVPYAAVYNAKMAVFKEMYAVFVSSEVEANSERAQKFAAFVEESGSALQDYCLYQVLATVTDQRIDELSEEERDAAAARYAELVSFQAYLQWLANDQLQACQNLAVASGMSIGLMRDLAVGADGGGAEVSTNLDLFCREAAVGAPPDPLAEKGQNWGLPPMDPATLRLSEFRHLINLYQANMAHCGALRIDHAMALMRLWWCPPGKTADFGAYVYYPFREMLGLLKLESVRNQCLVIGEDMGVVPAEFREAISAAKVFTNKLFYFEKDHQGQFRLPGEYDPHSLAMLTNHDVPTLASWWLGSDLDLRRELDLLEEGIDFEQVVAQRQAEKLGMLEWLSKLNLVKPEQYEELLSQPLSEYLASAILHGASQCASQIFVVQLEDLELLEDPVNVPGTSTEYANWQRKLAVNLEQLFSEQRVQHLLSAIATERS